MLIDADLSQLEYRVAAELSGDMLMRKEIIDGLDIHTANATELFNDVAMRQEAKVLTFRMIYGGSPYAFFMDNNMPNFTLDKWEDIVNSFYKKYNTLKKWQDSNYREVCKTGKLVTPTGRTLIFKKKRKSDGSWIYPRPSVCNYPVQSVSTADIVPLAMVEIERRISLDNLNSKCYIINQVHDSIILDCSNDKKIIDSVCRICYTVFNDLPLLIKEWFNLEWETPLTGECKFGNNWSKMELWCP